MFDPGGVYLGQVVGPVGTDSWLMAWREDDVAAISEDEEGLPMVVKYEISREVKQSH